MYCDLGTKVLTVDLVFFVKFSWKNKMLNNIHLNVVDKYKSKYLETFENRSLPRQVPIPIHTDQDQGVSSC